LALSNRSEALAHFSRARDDDALPFRADSHVNGIIAETARAHAGRGVHFFDAIAAVAEHSPADIPGDEFFYEHVHFNFDGNYLLARSLADTIAGLLPPPIAQRKTGEWASQEECERTLGLTDWNRHDVFDNVIQRLGQPPFAGQPDNGRRVNLWRARLNEASTRLTAASAGAARALYLEAIRRSPDDFRLHWNFAEFLEATRDLPRALEEWRRVQSLIPHHHIGHFQAGRLLAELTRRDEARNHLNRAVALRPDLGAGWFELGRLSLAEDRADEAQKEFETALKFNPDNPQIRLNLGMALFKQGRNEEAARQFEAALRLDPQLERAKEYLEQLKPQQPPGQ
jgi:tetratricopeptide (TPR) repeat protein